MHQATTSWHTVRLSASKDLFTNATTVVPVRHTRVASVSITTSCKANELR